MGTGLSLGLTVSGTLGSKLRSLESKQWPWSHRMVRGLDRGNLNDIRTDCSFVVAPERFHSPSRGTSFPKAHIVSKGKV